MKVAHKKEHIDLVNLAKKGDLSSQRTLYNTYAKAMLNVAYRIVNNREDAQDVLQDAFVRAFNGLDQYRGESTFGAWLKRIVINVALDWISQNKIEWTDMSEVGEKPIEETDMDQVLSVDHIKHAVGRLADGFRVVFSLYAFEGYDHKEIAQILSISESTSKTQYNRAKVRIKEVLKEVYDYER